MSDLTPKETETVFDFLELRRGDKLGCPICGGNDWSARKVRRAERGDPGPEVWTLYLQLICKNCKHVADFAPSIFDGI